VIIVFPPLQAKVPSTVGFIEAASDDVSIGSLKVTEILDETATFAAPSNGDSEPVTIVGAGSNVVKLH
jgi:hypothetical protein